MPKGYTVNSRVRNRATAADLAAYLKSQARPARGAHQGEARDALLGYLLVLGLPGWEREFVFHPTRKWRFDLCHPAHKIAVEIEGLVFVDRSGPNPMLTGRHASVKGFLGDVEKYGEAFRLGYNVLRITSKEAKSGTAANWIAEHLKGRR